jgi:hypothetical protein
LLRLRGERAKAQQRQKDASRITNKPIKKRTLKNPASPRSRRAGADAEVECVFMVELHFESRFLIETIRTINRFNLGLWT